MYSFCCLLPYAVFKIIPTNKGYWLATELFVKLHKGKDYHV
jgi:hypothetical protein